MKLLANSTLWIPKLDKWGFYSDIRIDALKNVSEFVTEFEVFEEVFVKKLIFGKTKFLSGKVAAKGTYNGAYNQSIDNQAIWKTIMV